MTLRRDFLAFTAGAVAARTVLPLAAKTAPEGQPSEGAHPDATLLTACASFAVACAGIARINATPDLTDEDAAPIIRQWNAPIDTITNLPATTLDGIRAKAQAVIDAFESGGVNRSRGESVEQAAGYHELMAWRLAHNILAFAGRVA